MQIVEHLSPVDVEHSHIEAGVVQQGRGCYTAFLVHCKLLEVQTGMVPLAAASMAVTLCPGERPPTFP